MNQARRKVTIPKTVIKRNSSRFSIIFLSTTQKFC